MDLRKSTQTCLIRINANVNGENKVSDIQLRKGKPSVYKIGNKKYLIHVLDILAYDKCTLRTYRA